MASVFCVEGVKSLPIAEFTSFGNFKLKRAAEVVFADYWRQQSRFLSPYSMDYNRRCAVFVQTSLSVTQLKSQTFLYQAQRDHAEWVLRVPFDELLGSEKSAFVGAGNNKKLFFLHSTGRCGSTLLCKLLEDSGDIAVFSEPDFYSQWVMLSQKHGAQLDARIPKVVGMLTSLLLAALDEDLSIESVVIKLRGVCINVAEKMQQSHVNAKNIFLYRNAYDTGNSFLGLLLRLPLVQMINRLRLDRLPVYWLVATPGLKSKLRAFAPLCVNPHYNRVSAIGGASVIALSWLSKMDLALELSHKQPRFFLCCVRYEDLMKDAQGLMQALVPLLMGEKLSDLAQINMNKTLCVNSQEGSDVKSDGLYRLGVNDIERIDQVLSKHGVINDSDYQLPNTLVIAGDKTLTAGA
ncbi:MAG: hypothetical protein KUG76_03175 [Gammaproteobacteria bacterium]|nr:hypothetical protein [Gammaproteobacteria bacterium]